MPELSIVTMQQCSDLDGPKRDTINGYHQYMDHGYVECSCPAFKFSKGHDKWCKHLTELQESLCSYHEQFDGPPETDGVCPKCGKKTSYVRVGV